MSVGNLFKTSTRADAPFDGSLRIAADSQNSGEVSDFLTVQSLTNFAVMTAAISAAWMALERLDPRLSTLWVPYTFAGLFALVSVLISTDSLKTNARWDLGKVGVALFIAVINGLILASAIVGAKGAA